MTLTINNKKIKFKSGQTILEVATANGFAIPTLCYHPDLKVQANCRLCVVEIEGHDHLETACSTLALEGMKIITDSPRIREARRLNLELIFSEHEEKCVDCLRRFDCNLLKYAREYQANISRFTDRKKKRKTYCFSKAVEIDGGQCIDCKACLEACQTVQKINYLEMRGSGINQEIVPTKDRDRACIYCGQCTLYCPAASAQEQSAVAAVEAALADKQKIVIAQFAPSLSISLREEFSSLNSENCEGKIKSALKQLGFDYVFDTGFGVDIASMLAAEELLKKLKDKQAAFPLITSSCPAWASYVEFYHPELLPHLSTIRSPHIQSAGMIKTYWAKKNNLNPRNIILVSIGPCTAEKHESIRPELFVNGRPLLDQVLTIRELVFLIKKNRLDFSKLPEKDSADLFNGSGAAVIYGTPGGTMGSVLHTATALSGAQKKNKISNNHLEFKTVRGLTGFKEAVVNLQGKRWRVGVVNGIANIEHVLPHLKKYHYLEVRSCPDACVGGGGQVIPTTKEIKKKRMAELYRIGKKRSIRWAFENKAILAYYNWVKEHKLEKKLLYTKFKRI